MEIQVGSKVILNSGGPVMDVEVMDVERGRLLASWAGDNGFINRNYFPIACVKPAIN